MTNYQKMYTTLFNKITDVIYELQEIQQITEEIFIASDESNTVEVDRLKEDG